MLWNVFDRDFLLPPPLFDRGSSALVRGQQRLPLSLEENEEGLRLRAEVPGFQADELDLRLEGRQLSLTATKEGPTPDDGTPGSPERLRLKRELVLPMAVDSEGLTARLEDGVLTVLLPRAAEAAPVSIQVSSH